jgi:hypothetical protein
MAGIITIPPPIPKNPESTPTPKPKARNKSDCINAPSFQAIQVSLRAKRGNLVVGFYSAFRIPKSAFK